jgi:predicted O-methyltransferase YrrM
MQAMRAQLDMALADLDAGRSGNCREKLREVITLCDGLDPYLEAVHRPFSEPMQHLQQASQEVDWKEKFRKGETKHLFDPGMSCSSMVLRTLQFVSRLVGATRCLQLGLSTGEAALATAEVLPAHGHLLVLEEDRFFVNFAQKHFRKSPYASRISIQRGDAATLLKELQAGSDGDRFDVIFMDGNKSEYATYLDLIVSRKLLVPGGIIVADDVLWKGGVYDASPLDDHGTKCSTCWPQSPWPSKLPDPEVASVMAAMNDCMTRHAQLEPLVLPIHNGLSLLRYVPQEVLQEAAGSFGNNTCARETVLLQEGMPAKVPVTPEMLPHDAGSEVDDFYDIFALPERQSTAPAVLYTHGRRSWSPHFKPATSLETPGSASAGLRRGLFGKQGLASRQVSGQTPLSRQVSSSSHGSSFPPVPRWACGAMQQHGWETPVQMWPATPDDSPTPTPRPQWLEPHGGLLPWL